MYCVSLLRPTDELVECVWCNVIGKEVRHGKESIYFSFPISNDLFCLRSHYTSRVEEEYKGKYNHPSGGQKSFGGVRVVGRYD